MPPAGIILDRPMRTIVNAVPLEVTRSDRRLAVTAGNIEHIGWLAQPRESPPQTTHKGLSLGDVGAQMRGAGGKIGMVQVIGLDASFDHCPHQGAEYVRIVIHTLEQHRLAEQHESGIDHPRDRMTRLRIQFTRMVDV